MSTTTIEKLTAIAAQERDDAVAASRQLRERLAVELEQELPAFDDRVATKLHRYDLERITSVNEIAYRMANETLSEVTVEYLTPEGVRYHVTCAASARALRVKALSIFTIHAVTDSFSGAPRMHLITNTQSHLNALRAHEEAPRLRGWHQADHEAFASRQQPEKCGFWSKLLGR